MQKQLVNHIVRGVLGAAVIASVVLAYAQASSSDRSRVDAGPAYAQVISTDDNSCGSDPWSTFPLAS